MSLDLSSHYGGLTLPTPVVVGACPMTTDEQTRMSLAAAGAGAKSNDPAELNPM